eukprot:XP_001698820.1 gamma hydroxybutyrate dehydrogenase [Chlamydomonas reinhardtii]
MADAKLNVGFLGLGIMGEAMARNLMKSGLFASVTVWNRTLAKCQTLVSEGAKMAETPAAVVSSCDITFAMLADPDAALAAVFSDNGVLKGISAGKGYVDMSTVDEATSTKIGEAVTAAGGRFVEGPVSGSKKPAIDGQLIIMGAGDKELYEQCQVGLCGFVGKCTAVCVAGRKWDAECGDVGGGGGGPGGGNLGRGGEASGLEQSALLEILGLGAMANPMFAMKGPAIMGRAYPPAFPLKHQQKDLRLALALGDALNQPLPVAAAANESFKTAKALGRGDEDFAAVYEATQK